MPKKYPIDVRLFVVQTRAQGHSWDRVAEMVKQKFGLARSPSRRQMTKWIVKGSVPGDALREIERRLPAFAPEWISTQRDSVTKAISESIAGKQPLVVWAKWVFSQFKPVFGFEVMKTAWAEFSKEEEQAQSAMPPGTNLKLEEGGKGQ